MKVTLWSLKWHMAYAVIPRLAVIGFTFCQPFLLNRSIDYASEPSGPLTKSIGYGLIAAYAIVYMGVGVSSANALQSSTLT
jgi:ATP-binding cassette, subfamily C (CFTR/MRP), member 1